MQFIIGIIGLAVVGSWFVGGSFIAWFWTIVVVCVVIFVMILWSSHINSRNAALHRAEEQKRWKEIACNHRENLVLRYRQLARKNAYGAEELKGWQKELVKFRESVGIKGHPVEVSNFDRELTKSVQDWLAQSDRENASTDFESNDPLEYEIWCARTLRVAGWDAETTKAAGDQGVDVIAAKNGVKVALQCKLYSGKVGNKAVQEVHAAAAFVGAQHSVVVSNAEYTESAKQLAAKLKVLLLHHRQVPILEQLLKLENTIAT